MPSAPTSRSPLSTRPSSNRAVTPASVWRDSTNRDASWTCPRPRASASRSIRSARWTATVGAPVRRSKASPAKTASGRPRQVWNPPPALFWLPCRRAGPRPRESRALTALAQSVSPAPTAPNAGARSNTVTAHPARRSPAPAAPDGGARPNRGPAPPAPPQGDARRHPADAAADDEGTHPDPPAVERRLNATEAGRRGLRSPPGLELPQEPHVVLDEM